MSTAQMPSLYIPANSLVFLSHAVKVDHPAQLQIFVKIIL